jgi:hypothetical protein
VQKVSLRLQMYPIVSVDERAENSYSLRLSRLQKIG